jgi:activator of Hsp90 ATPase-like protein
MNVSTLPGIEDLTLNIEQEIRVRASLETTFAALLEQLGPGGEHPDGTPMKMKLEAWPGGRWFRDLGNNAGHFWGTVQAIKPPSLLEVCGPLFISTPVANNIQYRLTEENGVTQIRFVHRAMGWISEGDRGVEEGWNDLITRIRTAAEKRGGKKPGGR